jgi:hypothetical protein
MRFMREVDDEVFRSASRPPYSTILLGRIAACAGARARVAILHPRGPAFGDEDALGLKQVDLLGSSMERQNRTQS